MEDISTAQIQTAPSLTGRAEGESVSPLIAKTFQGLEPLLAQELTELGATDIQIGRRMVTFSGDKDIYINKKVDITSSTEDAKFDSSGGVWQQSL